MAFVSASVSDGTSQPFGRSLFSLWVSQKKKKSPNVLTAKPVLTALFLVGLLKLNLKQPFSINHQNNN